MAIPPRPFLRRARMIEVTLTGSGVATAEGITVDYEKRARGVGPKPWEHFK